jgi:hypothetical protein
MRSMNVRGRQVSKRLAWARAVIGDDLDPEWQDEGEATILSLRGAMHGELDRDLIARTEPAVRDWQRYGRELEANAVAAGLSSLNDWLGLQADSSSGS